MFLASVITPFAVTVKDTIVDTQRAVQGRTELFPASVVSDRPHSLIQADRRLVAGLPTQRSGSVNVGFVVVKVALGQIFLQVLRFNPVNFIPSVLLYSEKQKKKKNHLHHRFAQ
jgi:hypothetical protein